MREAVVQALGEVRREKGLAPVAIGDADVVGEEGLGLDSLDMAELVARLDETLGIDPFASGTARFRTVGELVALYEQAG